MKMFVSASKMFMASMKKFMAPMQMFIGTGKMFGSAMMFVAVNILLAAILLLAQSCGDKADDPTPEPETVLPDPVTTDKGIPNGPGVSQSVGSSGGTVTSADGLLTISIPAGALSATKTITVQPITNNVSLGVGGGYRLGPEGTTFSQPVTLIFKYTNGMLQNKPAETLWITTQNTDGGWSANIRSVVDVSEKTITAKVTHFSDWSLGRFVDFSIAPTTAALKVGKSISLSLVGFSKDKDVTESPDDLVPLIPIVDDGLEPLTALTPIPPVESRLVDFRVKNWSLNGANAPVSNNNGALASQGNSCQYTAPAKRPSPSTVAVTAELETTNKEGTKGKFLIISSINIIDGDYYLRVTIDGTEYLYSQYGVDGSSPGNGSFSMVNSASEVDNVFSIGAAFYDGGSTLSNVFLASFENPGVGTASVSCFNDANDTKDEVGFVYDYSAKELSTGYTKRWKENDSCESESLCANFSRTFTVYENKLLGEVKGSFSGTIYDVPHLEGSGDNCVTPDQHIINGEFHLLLAK
jgi:hypothetical protein